MNYFRAMQADPDGLPLVCRSSRALGVRIPADICPSNGTVHPETGGMSVAPGSIWNVPHHRRPRGLGRGSTGPIDDRIFSITGSAVVECDLTVRPDPAASDRHAFVEPARTTSLERYELALASTRLLWQWARSE